MKLLLTLVVIAITLEGLAGHGYLKDPVNRASRWRVDSSAPTNYDDNGLNCGGYGTQWNKFDGKCGLCGDSYGDAQPRKHEIGGDIGLEGVVVQTYMEGDGISVTAKITTNHKGYFSFFLCNLDEHEVETEDCFLENKIFTSSGEENYTLPSTNNGDFSLELLLPVGLTCDHCVLQWTYVAGNNWGNCPDGTGALGCGPQEHFRTCSDIAIT